MDAVGADEQIGSCLPIGAQCQLDAPAWRTYVSNVESKLDFHIRRKALKKDSLEIMRKNTKGGSDADLEATYTEMVTSKGGLNKRGAMNMAGQFGSFVSAVVFGYLVKALDGRYSLALVPLAAMTAISALVFTRIDPTVPLVEDKHDRP